jgi:hypothetical protein
MPDIQVCIQGRDIYETLTMPVAPRKGDFLWLGSLTRGRVMAEVLVSKVEWSMEQATGMFVAWLTVRRIMPSEEAYDAKQP